MALVKRLAKGAPLTALEMDDNLTYLEGIVGAGTNGSGGTSGTNGSAGTTGSNGISGTAGTSGSGGTRGTSGTSGVSGTNGSSLSRWITGRMWFDFSSISNTVLTTSRWFDRVEIVSIPAPLCKG